MATLVLGVTTKAFTGNDEEKYSPFKAGISELAVYDIERQTGALYVVSEDESEKTVGDWRVRTRSEEDLLEDFWEGANSYDVFVSYNGRSHGLPFLYHRSAMRGVKPSVQIARQRYVTKQTLPYHVDLLDEFSFYGAMKWPKLEEVSRAYGLMNLEGEVSGLREDVQIMIELYRKWQEYFAPPSFLNKLEF